nr:S46 family peptidase [Chitinophagaceae bacterium]
IDSLKQYAKEMQSFYTSISLPTDRKISQKLFEMYAKDISADDLIDDAHIQEIYEKSFLSSLEKFNQLIQVEQKEDIKTLIKQDAAYKTFSYYDSLQKANLVFLKQSVLQLNRLYGKYLVALREYNKGKQFYPDANSTLRLTYGKVEGVVPQDGMIYSYFTTLDGAVRKHNENSTEFTLPTKLLQLYETKDFGQYAIQHKGQTTVPLAFLASNHTTGGNSGSPVLNAKGELVGTNFDRIWEGTMSDILFDPNLCRNITLDIRYTLFIIEKFGGAKWIIDELNIVK